MERCAGHDTHPDVPHMVDAQAIYPEPPRPDRVPAAVIITQFGDLHLNGYPLVHWYDLPPVLPGRWTPLQHRLESRIVEISGQPAFREVPPEKLAHRLDPKRAWLDRVLEEMRPEEPLTWVNVLFRAQPTESGLRRHRASSR